MARLPANVYLVTTDGNWEIFAVADDHPDSAGAVLAEVERRSDVNPGRVHVWRVDMATATEMQADAAPRLTERPPQ